MRIPLTVFEVMTLLNSVEDSDKPSVINPGLTVTQAKTIMINGIKNRTDDFSNSPHDVLTLSNALSVIHGRKPRGIRTEIYKVLGR